MSEIAIDVQNLSKQFRIGAKQKRYSTLRDTVVDGIAAPWRRMREAMRGRQGSSDGQQTIWALQDINFTVDQGDVLGIIGRNGAGKSTLLKILAQITEPTIGRVELDGRVGALLEVGTGFHPELTGRENIFLNGAILGMGRSEIDQKFDEIVAFAEVEQFLDTPVKHYSSGMYTRLAFAVAAHLEPEILVVDEVLAVGDVEFQKKCLGKMGDVAKSGRTVLFVSHNMAAVENLCTRGLVLRQGQVIFEGTTQQAVAAYLEQNKTRAIANLEDRTDREGNGRVRAVALRIYNAAGDQSDLIKMLDDFTIEIETVGTLRNAVIGVLFGNHFRQQMIRGYSWEQVADSIQLTGHNQIRCHFKSFPMMHGEYDIHLWIGQPGDVADFVENAATLTVEASDIFGTGRMPDLSGGFAVCKATWEINGAT